jgi:hypothetical protein
LCENKYCKKPLGPSIKGRRRITDQTRAGGRDWGALGLSNMVICPSCYNRVIETGKIQLKRHLTSTSSSSTQNARESRKKVRFVEAFECVLLGVFLAWLLLALHETRLIDPPD